MKHLLAVTIASSALAIAAPASADPVDLSSWTALTLNFPGGQGAGSWVLEAGNTAVRQVINADPSFFLNNLHQTAYTIEGSWQVSSYGGDDDYMGFAFGYQNSSNFYLFDWKRGTQGYVGRTANAGMTVKKFTGATGNGLTDLSIEEFWENGADFGDMSVLATNHGAGLGWASPTFYTFTLDFGLVANQFRIVVKEGVTTLWDVTVDDSTFTAGQFAFFNNSQANVHYAGFEQDGGVIVDPDPDPDPVPEPASMTIVGLGLLSWACSRRRRQA